MDAWSDIRSYLKTQWISGKAAYDKAEFSWQLLIDRRHEKLRIPLLVLGDVIGWSILLLGTICVFGVVLILLTVAVFPLFYLTRHLGGSYLLDRSTAFYGLGILAMSNVAVYCFWCLPDCDFLVKRYGVNTELSPGLAIQRSQFLFLFALWLGGSAFAAVICLDVLVLGTAVYYLGYKIYVFLRILINAIKIPRYFLLPAFVLFPFLFISLHRRSRSLRKEEIWAAKEIRVKKKWEKRAMQLERSLDNYQFTPGRLPV